MARSNRYQQYHYLFREGTKTGLIVNAPLNYEVAKVQDDGDGRPETIYHIWGLDRESLVCDCPAAIHHPGPCKHVGWLLRWLWIQDKRTEEIAEAVNTNRPTSGLLQPIFYNAADNHFYPFRSRSLLDDDEY